MFKAHVTSKRRRCALCAAGMCQVVFFAHVRRTAGAPVGSATHGPTTSRASSLVAQQAHKHAYTVPPGKKRTACTLSPALYMAVAQRRAEPGQHDGLQPWTKR